MLLKVALIDDRDAYRERLVSALASSYAENLEVTAFSSMESFDDYIALSSPVDVMLVSAALGSELLVGNRGALLLYLVDDKSIERLFDHTAICRYQKVESIYHALVDASLDRFDVATFRHESIEDIRVITFFPAGGGVGASTLAAACALGAAKRGMSVFYLNLELYGDVSTYFVADGTGNLSDALFAIEAKKHNVAARIQGLVRRSRDGVRFIQSCPSPIDLMELAPNHVEQLLREIAASSHYDLIVLDLDYPHSAFATVAMELSSRVVFVSNGTPTANGKFARILDALIGMGMGAAGGLENIVLAYNNFDARTGAHLTGDTVETIGSVGAVPHASTQQLVDVLSNNVLIDDLVAFDEE